MASSSAAAEQVAAAPSHGPAMTEHANGAADKEMGMSNEGGETSSLEDSAPAPAPAPATATASAPAPVTASVAATSSAPATDSPAQQDCGCETNGTDAAFVGPDINDKIPTSVELKKAYALNVIDEHGNKHTFQSIVQKPGLDKHLIIFIRHFFCGLCQQYIAHLSQLLPPSSLPPGTAVTIISNGHPSYIPTYRNITSCPYDLYVDPDDSPLYATLQLRHTLSAGGAKPAYMKTSFLHVVGTGIMQGLKAGRNSTRGGNSRQVGGEFLFVAGSGDGAWRCSWAHRMQNTRGHAEVEQLRGVLGLGASNGANTHKPIVPVNGTSNGTSNGSATLRKRQHDPVARVQRSESRLSRRMSARISGMWNKRPGSDAAGAGTGASKLNGHAVGDSEKAAGKRAAVPRADAAGTEQQPRESAAGGVPAGGAAAAAVAAAAGRPGSMGGTGASPPTIRPVNDSPRLI